VLAAGAVTGTVFVALPVTSVLLRTPWSGFAAAIGSPEARSALVLSLSTSLTATALVVAIGLPLAWVLARRRFPGRRIVRAVVAVPMVLPPVVAGVALLGAFGRTSGIVGGLLFDVAGVQLTFSPAGVVVAQSFVALPFFVLSAEAGIAQVDRRYEDVVATLGAGPGYVARAVVLRLAAPAVAAGGVLAWARALGEFGATITFAGNVQGRTQTLPLAVYLLLERDPGAAYALSAVLVGVAVAVLVLLRGRWLGARR
jgi:molybdate transport system permease protein